MDIDTQTFQFLAKFLKETSGYNLTEDKKYLLASRLEPVLATKECTLAEMLRELQKNQHGDMAVCVIEAMTVNETFFFRDSKPFETFEKHILPELAEHKRKIRIWSAASSTGQEPYSIAMILEEKKAQYPALNYEIIASDINNTVLAKARSGIYSNLEVHRGLPDNYRQKYFKQDGSQWKIADIIHSKITFQQLNLRKQYNLSGLFDFVLLRNVLIYFDAPMKEEILNKISALMQPAALLMLGTAEGIYGAASNFQRCKKIDGLYRHEPSNKKVA